MFRKLVYQYAIFIVLLATAIITFIVFQTNSLPSILANQSIMMNVAVTLAGFLFTGQGIILTLSPKNRFIQLVKKYGYMKDFNNLCRWSELLFVFSILLGIDIINVVIFDIFYFFTFLSGLIFALWSLVLFSSLVKYYIDSEA